jgi:hypothetical protein
MKKLFFIFLLVLTYAINLTTLAEVRFVSKTGSSTPPYTSWATAADSIQKCINFSQSGDTIYVANGTYKEYIRMIPNIALIGSGIDSCVIDTRGITIPDFKAIIVEDSCKIQFFNVIVRENNDDDAAITTSVVSNETYILNNHIENCAVGILVKGSAIISHNIINNVYDGILISSQQTNNTPTIEFNYLNNAQRAIYMNWFMKPTIRNNTIYLEDGDFGITVWAPDSSLCANNVVIAGNCEQGIGYSDAKGSFFNNAVIGNCTFQAMRFWKPNEVYNNLVVDGDKGIEVHENRGVVIQYNNVWNMNTPYINHTPDSTNLSFNPMFVDKEGLDLHLQMFSPLIDAGNPNNFDRDGSRSDIGIYGGPLGETYLYRDLPPSIPCSIQSNISGDTLVTINWELNTEEDFKHYNIYRDSVSGFNIDSISYLYSTDTSFIEDTIKGFSNNIYYKITAIDSQSNESLPSDEIAFLITGIEPPTIKTIGYYHLFQNYPNPFNPETIIGYKLKEPGYVKLRVYDIKGEFIEELVNEYKNRGYHEVNFIASGTDGWKNKLSGLASGIYLYKLDVIDDKNIPVYSQIKKMILIK